MEIWCRRQFPVVLNALVSGGVLYFTLIYKSHRVSLPFFSRARRHGTGTYVRFMQLNASCMETLHIDHALSSKHLFAFRSSLASVRYTSSTPHVSTASQIFCCHILERCQQSSTRLPKFLNDLESRHVFLCLTPYRTPCLTPQFRGSPGLDLGP